MVISPTWAQAHIVEVVVVVVNNNTINNMGSKISTIVGVTFTFFVPNAFWMKTILYKYIEQLILLQL